MLSGRKSELPGGKSGLPGRIAGQEQYWQLPGRKSGFLFVQYSLPLLITCRQDGGENAGREESVPVLIMSRIQCAMGIPGGTSGINKYLQLRICTSGFIS